MSTYHGNKVYTNMITLSKTNDTHFIPFMKSTLVVSVIEGEIQTLSNFLNF